MNVEHLSVTFRVGEPCFLMGKEGILEGIELRKSGLLLHIKFKGALQAGSLSSPYTKTMVHSVPLYRSAEEICLDLLGKPLKEAEEEARLWFKTAELEELKVESALDLGAGFGRFSRLLEEISEHNYAYESEAEFLNPIIEYSPRTEWIEYNDQGETIPLVNECMELIIAPSFPATQLERLAPEICRIQKPGGKLCFDQQPVSLYDLPGPILDNYDWECRSHPTKSFLKIYICTKRLK